jgi:hypothetical protein
LTDGKPSQALAFGEAALLAHENALGPNHPWTKDSARTVIEALTALGRDIEAGSLRVRHALEPDISQKK